MSVSGAEMSLKQAERNLDSAEKRHLAAAKKQTGLENDITKLEGRAVQSRSEAQVRSYVRQVDTKRGQLSGARTDVSRRLEDATKAREKVGKAKEKLRTEEEAERKRQERADAQKARQADQRRQQQERADERQRKREEQAQRAADAERDRREAEQDNKITELERRLEEASREAAPAEVAVLFLASAPEDQDALRLDKETREIEKRVRSSEHRDSIYFRARMARQLVDLLDDLNEVRPAILHFSGHGDQSGLAFEDESGATAALDNALLGRLLDAAAQGVRLIVFNSCDSASQAELAVRHVDLAIGMDASIDDEDAKVFAGQFYNSLGFGHSIADAFRQAKVHVELSGGDGEVPALFSAEEVDPETVVLVNPDAGEDA
ncbi:MAG TPA: CHAT domain-containing protein [Solirubrobacterales bacterium]|nr:CHAT domain-containing protein [Solirubrobacterales bacterium]